MTKNYSTYTSTELLQDDYFIQSMLYPTTESDIFWDSLIADNILKREEFEQALSFLETMEKPVKIMSVKEKSVLWASIEIINKQKLREKIKRRNFYLFGTAVSFLIAIASFMLFAIPDEQLSEDIVAIAENQSSVSDAREIQLIMSGNTTYELEEKNTDIVVSEEGRIHVNSELLAEQNPEKEKQKHEESYNQLIIPRGRHSRLTLPDGTKMHINSGSRVVFPNIFSSNKREIFVDGEVFLDVAHNAQSPFIVRTNKMRVQVLGTTFNVSAYEEDENQSVVLVSGSVTIQTNDKEKTELLPNQMMTYSSDGSRVTKVNVNNYIAWKEGYFIYEGESLQTILKQLSRYYGKELLCDPPTNEMLGNGKLDLKEDLDRVLQGLSDMFPIDIVQNEDIIYVKEKI